VTLSALGESGARVLRAEHTDTSAKSQTKGTTWNWSKKKIYQELSFQRFYSAFPF
jgi:hypothetical protein